MQSPTSQESFEHSWNELWNQAQALIRHGDLVSAEGLLDKLMVMGQTLPATDSKKSLVLENQAQVVFLQGKYVKAEPLVKEIINLHSEKLGPEHPDVGVYINNLALLYHKQRKYFLAESEYQKALEIQTKQLGMDHPHTLNVVKNYASLLRETHRQQAAVKLEEKCKVNAQGLNELKDSGVYQAYKPLSQIKTRETLAPRVSRYNSGNYNVSDTDAETLQNLIVPEVLNPSPNANSAKNAEGQNSSAPKPTSGNGKKQESNQGAGFRNLLKRNE
ncbi:MAG: tetratricopeptide repeat protein [Candidatus Obscuribacterales bacterium]|nr:tetratricopeptide repeat protein [Candidatus Obscuribacterales bacterium]